MSILQTLKKSEWYLSQKEYCTLKGGRGYPPVEDERLRPLVAGLRREGAVLIDLTAGVTTFQALAEMVNAMHEHSPGFVWNLGELQKYAEQVPKLYLGTMKPLWDLMNRYWVDISPKNRRTFGKPHGILDGVYACPEVVDAAQFTDPGELTGWLTGFGLDHDYVHTGVILEVNPLGWGMWSKALEGLLTPELRERELILKLCPEEGAQSPLPLPRGFIKPVAQIAWDMPG